MHTQEYIKIAYTKQVEVQNLSIPQLADDGKYGRNKLYFH